MGDPDTDYLIAGCAFVATHPGYEGLNETDGNVQRLGRVLLELLDDDPINAQWREAVHDIVQGTPDLVAPVRGNTAFLLNVLPADIPFRPPRMTPRLVMPGPQTAIVVGPAGEEIHTDKYGRVKVQFHWDRDEQEETRRPRAGCACRSPGPARTGAAIHIPRIGQEVVVDFLEGDPDRPLITGRVYNGDHMPP